MIFGALAVLLILLALAFLVIPLLREPKEDTTVDREQQNIAIARDKQAVLQQQLDDGLMTRQEFDDAMKDLEASLALDLERQQKLEQNRLAGKWAVAVFAVLVPVISVYMYYRLGDYRIIENPQLAVARAETASSPSQPALSMEQMIQKVKDHLKDNPDDARGWFVLGRAMMSLQKYEEALTAFRRSYDLNPDEPTVALALADALAMNHNGSMKGRPEQLVKKALMQAPNDPTALWLAGLADEQSARYRDAYDKWTRLLPLLQGDPQSVREVRDLIAGLRQKDPSLPELKAIAVPASGASITLKVDLDPSLRSQARPSDKVFIYAKAASGPPMPLAVRRVTVADLPLEVTLSDGDAMMPQMKLSSFDRIVVGARVSKSGNPIAAAGDLYAETSPLERSGIDAPIGLVINRIKSSGSAGATRPRPGAVPQPVVTPKQPPAAGASITLQVDLGATLLERAQPSDKVFIYAKAASGPPMPLAVRRVTVADLPLEVTLSDGDAMMPQMKLSSFDRIVVGARVSKSGNPIASSGDLFTESEALERSRIEGPVRLIIDKIKP